MKHLRFGNPEEFVPSRFCPQMRAKESDVSYDLSRFQFKLTARGCVLEFPLKEEEQIYGFGLQLKGFNHKNRKLQLRTNSDPVAYTGDSHAPVPFFASTAGYGMYFDTARYAEVHCGYGKNKNRKPEPDNRVIATAEDLYQKCGLKETTVMSIEIPVAKGVDVYLFEGDSILDIVSEYNRFSGGGPLVPAWGLGVMFRPYARSTDRGIMELADYFRKKDIPCDCLGVEPGWQSSSYSCSYLWDEERFPEHEKMIAYLKERDFRINLWEHAFVNACSPLYGPLKPLSGDYEVWKGLIPDFSLPEARAIFAKHHREYLVEKGIDGFKLDECDNSDYVQDWSFPNCTAFPGGLDGEQYHQLFGSLYVQTILEAMGGRETYGQVRQMGALAASYPFVLASDLYDHKDFIRGVVNSGFSGLLWTPELRDAASRKDLIRRLQTVVFSHLCLINSWYCQDLPWKEWECEEEVRELLKLRKSLIPMLKAAFDAYHESGKPPIRALVMDYTDDPMTWSIDDEYLFCDSLLVAPLTAESDTRQVYLPAGQWRDFWSKESLSAGWHTVTTEKIPVYEKI